MASAAGLGINLKCTVLISCAFDANHSSKVSARLGHARTARRNYAAANIMMHVPYMPTHPAQSPLSSPTSLFQKTKARLPDREEFDLGQRRDDSPHVSQYP